MDKNNDKNFIPLKEQINSFSSFLLNEKLDILRKLSRDITFNEDYQQDIIKYNFIPTILDYYLYYFIKFVNMINNKKV